MAQSFGEMLDGLRAKFRPRGTADIVLIHPGSNGFVECTSAEVGECIDELERLGLLGEKTSPLQALAIRLLTEGW